MTDVETGYKAVAFIINKETSIVATMPCLGTNADEANAAGTGPASAVWGNITGITSIGLPEDNGTIDIPRLESRIIERIAGQLAISSRLEKWKKDSMWLGAVNGLASYAANKTTYPKSDDLLKYDILVYTGVPMVGREAVAGKSGSTGYADESAIETVLTGWDEKIKLLNVKLGSYDMTIEPNIGIKETVAYAAEDITITKA